MQDISDPTATIVIFDGSIASFQSDTIEGQNIFRLKDDPKLEGLRRSQTLFEIAKKGQETHPLIHKRNKS